MSMLSSYIRRQVKKRGAKALMLKILEMIVKATPSKTDDMMVAKVKEALEEFEDA